MKNSSMEDGILVLKKAFNTCLRLVLLFLFVVARFVLTILGLQFSSLPLYFPSNIRFLFTNLSKTIKEYYNNKLKREYA